MKAKAGFKTLRATRPNAGVEAMYSKRLVALIREMHKSVVWYLSAAWKKNDLAMDSKPAIDINMTFKRLARRWQKKFDELSSTLANIFASSTLKATDVSVKAALKTAGFTVGFKMPPSLENSIEAIVAENVGLIKSIPQQYLTQGQGSVMRAVSQGGDLHSVSQDLKNHLGVTERRANFIARDQSKKATGVINRARYKELGLTHAIWMHSHGGVTPRPSHLKANGQRFDLEKGMFLDNEWVFPGELINCKCVMKVSLEDI